MKIGLVIEHLDPRRGGAEQWTHQFARWLARAGHEVHVVADGFAPGAERTGIVPHRLPPSTGRLGFARAAERRLDALALDLVHDMGQGWHCDLFQPHGGSRAAAFEQNLCLLPRWLRPFKRRAARWLPRYRDFRQLTMGQYIAEDRIFIAISRMVARDFERFHGVRREQVRLVYNGVDTERFSPGQRSNYRRVVRDELGVADDELLLLIVAHNFRLKGVPALLAAAGLLAADGWPVRLAVVGGKHHSTFDRMSSWLGASGVTRFVGPVDDAVPYYAAADAYVQPTWYDPCSLVLLEALASGLPVVTSPYNGAGELVIQGREGWIVDDPGDPRELVRRLQPLFDPATRQRMSIAARTLAEAHSLDRNCRELLAVYDEVVTARRRRAA
ncbi:MAG TPA: glycosyltransferase family 4 protein [Pirellulales bacterium]|nr:glycosyltransferase family 4 protein [Pirellulales bacterium]